jgi:hypothetical protein
MAVNKPVGDNARKGVVRKAHSAQEQDRRSLDQAQQAERGIYGREKEPEEVQGRSSREGGVISLSLSATSFSERQR